MSSWGGSGLVLGRLPLARQGYDEPFSFAFALTDWSSGSKPRLVLRCAARLDWRTNSGAAPP